jgi:2-polyprenyl-3-methyl-5-hydroxy-6-metoxy-1,4-benzoquinol methylase
MRNALAMHMLSTTVPSTEIKMKKLNALQTPIPPEFSYYQNVRSDLAEYVEKGNHRILDVGCGAGYFGEYLKQQGCASEVVGIEINIIAAEEAITKLDHVLCANLNQTSVIDVLKDFDKASFDYIVCADVLEHLIDPWEVLAQLVSYLKPNGRLVVSIPNVRHWSVWLPLIFQGHWEYREAGIMDRTHLRFFTRVSAIELLNRAGLDVATYYPLIGGKSRLIHNLSMGLLKELLAIQLVFFAMPKLRNE